MNTRKTKCLNSSGLSIVELLVVLAIVTLLCGMITPPLTHSRPKAKRIVCVNNLKNVGLAARIFATDHGDIFAWESRTNQPPIKTFEEFLPYLEGFGSNEIANPKIFACPADKQRTATTNWTEVSRKNVSYFFGLDAKVTYPQSFLAGDRNITTNGVAVSSGILKLSSTANAGWDSTIHQNQGNVVMGDGSVQQLSGARLRDQLRNTGTESSTLVIP